MIQFPPIATGSSLLAVGFLSGWMLLWSLAAAIPILLHFWARRKRGTIRWAAVHVLQQVVEKQSRRLRVEQIVLLLIRTLVPILLAIAFARPFLESASGPAGDSLKNGRRYLIFAIDTSHSMACIGPSGVSRFDQAKTRAIQRVRESGEADLFTVVAMQSPPDAVIAVPVIDKQMVIEAIEKLTISYRGMDLTNSLDLIEDLASRADGDVIPSNPAVHVFSDLGEDSWAAEEKEERLSRFNQRFELHIHAPGSDPRSNAAVVDLDFPSGAVLQGSTREIGVRIAQYGTPGESAMSRTLQILLGEQVVASRKVRLEPDSSQIVTFQIPWTQTGAQVLTAQLDSDGLEPDNVRRQWVNVVAATRVLVVEQVRGAGLPIEVALQASAEQADALKLKTISSVALVGEDLSDWDIVILQDVASISAGQASSLASSVRRGLGLIILHGPQTIAAGWNAASESAPGLLAYELSEPSEERAWGVDPLDYQSPIVAPFEGFPDSGFLTSPIFRFWQVRTAPDISVDIAFASGSPFIVHSELGRGRVVSVLSAPQGTPVRLGETDSSNGTPWNVLATWPSFLPLMQSIFDFAQRQDLDRTMSVGQMIQGSMAAGTQARSVRVQRPTGDVDTLTVAVDAKQGERKWHYNRTDLPGIYSASIEDQPTEDFVVNIPLDESRLVSIDPAGLPPTKETVPESEKTTQAGTYRDDSLWRWLLLSVAALLVCETWLAWWLGRRVG